MTVSSPAAGVGIFILPKFWGGEDLTADDAKALRALGVTTAYIKSSDGVTGNPDYPTQYGVAGEAGITPIPWHFFEPSVGYTAQMRVAWLAAGSPKGAWTLLLDVEAAITVASIPKAIAASGGPAPTLLVTTWDDPESHPGAPSIGQLVDIGVRTFVPQSYYTVQGGDAAATIDSTVKSYRGLNLSADYTLVLAVDGPDIEAAATAAAAEGCPGIVGWRYGANGITVESFSGAAAAFAPPEPAPDPVPDPSPEPDPAPTPTPPTAPTPLPPGTWLVPPMVVTVPQPASQE